MDKITGYHCTFLNKFVCNYKCILILRISPLSWWCDWVSWIQNKLNVTKHPTRDHRGTSIKHFNKQPSVQGVQNRLFRNIRQLQEGYMFFYLCTGCKITHQIWTSFPMTLSVIDWVNQIGLAERLIPLLTSYSQKCNPVRYDNKKFQECTSCLR